MLLRRYAKPLVLTRRVSGIVCAIATASCCVSVAPLAGASTAGWQSASLPRLPSDAFLYGVAARSPADVTAVGQTLGLFRPVARPGATLVLHWNGHRWTRQAAPSPGVADRADTLSAVSIVSSADAWAVGSYEPVGSHQSAMVLHWNGRRWSVGLLLPSEAICHGTAFLAVDAATASDLWAAGYHFSSSCRGPVLDTALLYHYNGRGWTRVGVPAPPGTILNAISGTSGRDIWAVGQYGTGTQQHPLTLHFDGHRWARILSPHGRGTSTVLSGVDAVSPSSAFAVGVSGVAFVGSQNLIAYWDGTNWQPQPTLQNATGGANVDSSLAGIAATSPNDAWAVGETDRSAPSRRDPFGHTPYEPVILHWDGATWQRQHTPNLGGGDHPLTAIAATSSNNVWTVGNGRGPFILHCC